MLMVNPLQQRACRGIAVLVVSVLSASQLSARVVTEKSYNRSLVRAPIILLEETRFNFGEVYQGATVTHRFLVRNAGRKLLKITGVSSDCGCTVAEPSRTKLRPGEKAFVEVKFRSDGYRGPVRKHVWVDSNDQGRPEAEFTLTGTVKIEIEPMPTGVYGGRMAVKEVVQRTVMLRPVGKISFRITEAKSSDPAVRVASVGPAGPDQPAGTYAAVVEFGPMTSPRHIVSTLTFVTTAPHAKRLTLSAYARVVE